MKREGFDPTCTMHMLAADLNGVTLTTPGRFRFPFPGGNIWLKSAAFFFCQRSFYCYTLNMEDRINSLIWLSFLLQKY